jgi:hypothetical protein
MVKRQGEEGAAPARLTNDRFGGQMGGCLTVWSNGRAMKVLHPHKWWAIRGNHETREVNGNQVDWSWLGDHISDGWVIISVMAG